MTAKEKLNVKKTSAAAAVVMLALGGTFAVGRKTATPLPASPVSTMEAATWSCVRDLTPINKWQARRQGCRLTFDVISGVNRVGGIDFPNVIKRQTVELNELGEIIGNENAEVPKEFRNGIKALFTGKLAPLAAYAK